MCHGLTRLSGQTEHQGGGQGEEGDRDDETDHVEETHTLQLYGKGHPGLAAASRKTCTLVQEHRVHDGRANSLPDTPGILTHTKP